MNASEARLKTNAANDRIKAVFAAIAEMEESVDEIVEMIEVAADRGDDNLTIVEWDEHFPNGAQLAKLTGLGYNIHHYLGGDFDRSEYYTISW